ncbi:hypothetical protein [Allocoleopsis sp.]|uniref:hypothetical protein n=1 Tax=Allocoleopsis sp. TaxID=3088169 RepID=UPI002FD0A919
MNIKAITLAAILGLSTPTIADLAINSPVIAAPKFPTGTFMDDTWSVSLSFENNSYFYSGKNMRTGSSLLLSGATTSGNNQRRVFTWRNGPNRYQVVWRPSDPDVIRVQVFAPNGKEILNRLLSQNAD